MFPGVRKDLRSVPLLLALALACLTWPVPARAELVIRFSHVVARDTPKGLAVERFKQLVEKASGGAIRVVVHPAARLYNDLDEMEALRLGAVEMLAPSLSKFGRIGFPEFELFDLPFLFEQLSDVRRITQGPIGQRLLGSLERHGLVGLGFFDNGFKQMSANRPLLAPSDFQGLRMRVQSSRVIAAQFRALGARPVVLAFSETRRALETGVVDGTENPVSNFWTQQMHRVQTDLSLTNHGYLGYAVVANQRFWDSLTPPERQLVTRAMREALDYGNAIADAENARALQALRATGTTRVHALTEPQRAQLRATVQPVYDQLSERIGANWIRDVQQVLGR
jgi:C4-dicarboxylate-binding protein DctP